MKKIHKNEKGFGAIEVIIVLVVIGAIGVAGFFVYQSKRMIATDTECFSISVPKNWQIKSTNATNAGCYFAAYSGDTAKDSEFFVAVLPYKSKIPNLQEAESALVSGAGSIKKADGQTKVGDYDAVYLKGPSIVNDTEKYAAIYVVLSPKPYSPTELNYSTDAFRITVGVPKNDKSVSEKIVDSITWH